MSEFLFVQGCVVLCRQAPTIAQLEPLLEGFLLEETRPADADWRQAGASLLLEYQPERGGVVQVDVVDQPWPDALGGPDADPSWASLVEQGAFGPFCSAGCLERACQQSHAWPEAREVVAPHQAFVRVRLGYSVESQGARSSRRRRTEETELVVAVAEALLEHPSALAYFNPSGEVLLPFERLSELADQFRQASLPALPLLTNRRLLKLPEADETWMVMDTVGAQQLGQVDLEVAFTSDCDLQAMALFLVNMGSEILKTGQVPKDGHTRTGPGGQLFEARHFAEPQMVPVRPVIRFRARDGKVSPPTLGFGDKPLGRRAWWQFWKL